MVSVVEPQGLHSCPLSLLKGHTEVYDQTFTVGLSDIELNWQWHKRDPTKKHILLFEWKHLTVSAENEQMQKQNAVIATRVKEALNGGFCIVLWILSWQLSVCL